MAQIARKIAVGNFGIKSPPSRVLARTHSASNQQLPYFMWHNGGRGVQAEQCSKGTNTNFAQGWVGFRLPGGGGDRYSPLAAPPPPKRLN